MHENFVSTFRPNKRIKTNNPIDYSTITLGYLFTKKNAKRKAKRTRTLKILFDTGCSGTIIRSSKVKDLKQKASNNVEWSTKTGAFNTNTTCNITFVMPQFHKQREVTWKAYVDNTTSNDSRYDMIIGRDLMHEIGIKFDFQEGRITWDNAWINMQSPMLFNEGSLRSFEEELFLMHDPETTDVARIQDIIDVKYNAADLNAVVKDIKTINEHQKKQLHALNQLQRAV